jgi:phage-related protein
VRASRWSGCMERSRLRHSPARPGSKLEHCCVSFRRARISADPVIGPRCGALRVRDKDHSWRIMFRVDADAVLVLDVYPKKTRKIPDEVVDRCRRRLQLYDAAVEMAARKQKAKRDRR